MSERQWDIGDPEPPEDVTGVYSVHFGDTDEYEDGVPLRFGRTRSGWKTYLFGGKAYYDWDEVVRRFGPVREIKERTL